MKSSYNVNSSENLIDAFSIFICVCLNKLTRVTLMHDIITITIIITEKEAIVHGCGIIYETRLKVRGKITRLSRDITSPLRGAARKRLIIQYSPAFRT